MDLNHVLPYVNWQTLLGHHLGLKGRVNRLLEEKDEKAVELKEKVDYLFNLEMSKAGLNRPLFINFSRHIRKEMLFTF